MVRLRKHKDTPQPGVWRDITADDARKWRRDAEQRVLEKRGGMLEYDIGRHAYGPGEGTREQGIIDVPKAEKPREGRETVEELARRTMDWVLDGTREEVQHKVKIVQQSSGMSHLTQAEALEQIQNLSKKLAEMDAQRAYAENDIDLGYTGPTLKP